jgi:hypothetical protein
LRTLLKEDWRFNSSFYGSEIETDHRHIVEQIRFQPCGAEWVRTGVNLCAKRSAPVSLI